MPNDASKMKKGWPKTVSEMNRWELADFLGGVLAGVKPGISYAQTELDQRRDRAMFHFLLMERSQILEIAYEFLHSEGLAVDVKFAKEA